MYKNLIFSLFVLLTCSLFAQKGQSLQTEPLRLPTNSPIFAPKWGGETSFFQAGKKIIAPQFDGCFYDITLPNLPYTSFLVPVRPYTTKIGVITEVQYEENFRTTVFEETAYKNRNELQKSRTGWYPESHILVGNVVKKGAEMLQEIRIYPMLVSTDGKQVKKALRLGYQLQDEATPENPPQVFRNYAAHSVLKDGDSYKMATTQEGMYRLDAAFFQSIGIDIGSINPAKIQIFGNGAGYVPQANVEDRYDDVHENPIFVSAQGNTFGQNDYVLFYGASPHNWVYNATNQVFQHRQNIYSDSNFYFLRIGQATGKRIETKPQGTATYTPSAAQNHNFHELEAVNNGQTGRFWVGEYFNNVLERTISLYVPNAKVGGTIKVSMQAATKAPVSAFFVFSTKNGTSYALTLGKIVGEQIYQLKSGTFTTTDAALDGDSLRIKVTFDKAGGSGSEGWLDWIEVNYEQNWNLGGHANAYFSLTEGVGTGNIADINLAGLDNSYQVWDITETANPISLPFSGINFSLDAEANRRLVAFKGNFKTPLYARKIIPQDLHSLALADYLMIVNPAFLAEAERLAEFHRNTLNHSVHIVTPAEIYNEFSGGKQDVTGIRDFIKMFHDRSQGAYPKYVLLFGDGSYDCKGIQQPIEKNFIPTYQSRNFTSETGSYTSDDFYVWLSDDEGFLGEGSGLEGDIKVDAGSMDAAVGRFPVETIEEAKNVVDKVIKYATNSESFGQWKNKVVLVGDYLEGEGITHMNQADGYTSLINASNPCFNIDKIYFDNYSAQITGSTTTFPGARADLLQKLDDGALILNWTGHGSEKGWSNSQILNNTDIQNTSNASRLPAIVTATCEFGRYDNPALRTGAEFFFIQPDAGAIAMFTTVRKVFSAPNETLNRAFYRHALKFDTLLGRYPTIGEIMQRTKNDLYAIGDLTNINSRNFTLYGDPGLSLAYPKLRATITHIDNKPLMMSQPDTIQSLAEVEIKGRIEDTNGTFLPNYNGEMEATIYDKANLFITKQVQYKFYWQKNRLFNGKVSVKNGLFSCKFVVPIDVSYEDGFGKISLYFHNDEIDGAGCFGKLAFSGTSTGNHDKIGPDVSLYINDENWIDGGTTFPKPDLYAVVSDESGINITSTGIGHEITAFLNGDATKPIVLNEYYAAKKDNYKEGTVRYNLRDLTVGEYTAKIRVWDAANNSSEAQTRFIIAENTNMALTQIFNYPNPFSSNTTFCIGHNQVGKELYAQVKIYTIAGHLVKTLETDFYGEGNYNRDMKWDGLDEYGDKIGRGTYVYQVTLRDKADGKSVSAFQKLVILR